MEFFLTKWESMMFLIFSTEKDLQPLLHGGIGSSIPFNFSSHGLFTIIFNFIVAQQ